MKIFNLKNFGTTFQNFNIKSKILPSIKEIHTIYLYFRPFIWFIFINEFFFDFYILEGESMLPTFEPYGNIVIVDKLTTNKFINKHIVQKLQIKNEHKNEIKNKSVLEFESEKKNLNTNIEEKTYYDILLKKLKNKFLHIFNRNFSKGEVVCVENPTNLEMKICKRVIYLEGDQVTLRNGNIITIPKNHVWVEGDNKDNSLDSRKFGPVPKSLILGRVPVRIWPKFKLL